MVVIAARMVSGEKESRAPLVAIVLDCVSDGRSRKAGSVVGDKCRTWKAATLLLGERGAKQSLELFFTQGRITRQRVNGD